MTDKVNALLSEALGIMQCPQPPLKSRIPHDVAVRNAAIYYAFQRIDLPRISKADTMAAVLPFRRNQILYIADTFERSYKRYYRANHAIARLFQAERDKFQIGNTLRLQSLEWYTRNLCRLADRTQYNMLYDGEKFRYVPVTGTDAARRVSQAGQLVTVRDHVVRNVHIAAVRIYEDGGRLTYRPEEFV